MGEGEVERDEKCKEGWRRDENFYKTPCSAKF